ncbi:MAG: hypothetical protein PVJ67_01495 [Candidatus Pacearchaeota archaeon]|jgi:hypothetical protein
MTIEESSDNYFVSCGEAMVERAIKRVVMKNGQLIIATHNTDWDEDGNFIGDYSKDYKDAEEYIKKYNPQRLNHKDYREAYLKGELPWQK